MIKVSSIIKPLNILNKKLLEQKRKYKAMEIMAKRLARVGQGQVITSKRVKEPWEKGRQAHGHLIGIMLQKQGYEPWSYEGRLLDDIQDQVSNQVSILMIESAKRRRSQNPTPVVQTIKSGAEQLAEAARKQIIAGKLGANSKKLRGIKLSYIKRGRATSKYGTPPALGIRTGRFVEGIRHRYKLVRG